MEGEFPEIPTYSSLSLDEYIRKRKMEDQFSLLNHRKREVNISEDSLDMDLDEYIRDAGLEREADQTQTSRNDLRLERSQISSFSKFDRKSITGEDSSDDEDEVSPVSATNEDVDMNGKFKTLETIEEEENDNGLEGLLNFSTAESKQGIRVPSQQWRMLPENLVDRPKGVKRLEFLPLDEAQRYRRVRKGKVHKNRSRTSSFSSTASDATTTTGTFVEKGKFTYKFGDRNRDGKTEGIIGIERAKHFNGPDPPVINGALTSAAAPINIHMNWDGFFNGFNQVVAKTQRLAAPATEPVHSELSSATERLLAVLQSQRDRTPSQKYNMEIQKDIALIQGRRPLVFADRGDGRQDIMASTGDGIYDYGNITHSTSMPLNIRFA